jgi:phosphoribosylformylglycinamidine (FGAM) synthase PurS component
VEQEISIIHIIPKATHNDPAGRQAAASIYKHLDIDTGSALVSKVFIITYPMSLDEVENFARECLADPVVDNYSVGKIFTPENFQTFISVSKKPGVTDDEGTSAQKTLADYLGKEIDTKTQHIFSQNYIFFENKLSDIDFKTAAVSLLGNGLINHFDYGTVDSYNVFVPSVEISADDTVETINIFISDEKLLELSQKWFYR